MEINNQKAQKYLDKLSNIDFDTQHSKYNMYMTKYMQYIMKGGMNCYKDGEKINCNKIYRCGIVTWNTTEQSFDYHREYVDCNIVTEADKIEKRDNMYIIPPFELSEKQKQDIIKKEIRDILAREDAKGLKKPFIKNYKSYLENNIRAKIDKEEKAREYIRMKYGTTQNIYLYREREE